MNTVLWIVVVIAALAMMLFWAALFLGAFVLAPLEGIVGAVTNRQLRRRWSRMSTADRAEAYARWRGVHHFYELAGEDFHGVIERRLDRISPEQRDELERVSTQELRLIFQDERRRRRKRRRQ